MDLAAIMVMDAPNSRLRARSSRPHSLLVKVVLPEGGGEGGREGRWVEEAWFVAVAEKELLVESRVFEEKEGGREGGKEGRRKYMHKVTLPYPVQTEEEVGEEGREEGVMMVRVRVEDGRKGGAARQVLMVRLLVTKKEDQVVQLGRPMAGMEGEREEGKEGGREEEKEGGTGEKAERGGGGGKNHERWVAPAPINAINIADLNKRGGGGKERVVEVKGEEHASILPARKEVGENNYGQSQEQKQQQQQQQREEEQQHVCPPHRQEERGGNVARQPDYEVTEEETHFSLLFPVPGIDGSSVQVNYSNRSSSSEETLNVVFSSSSFSSSSSPLSLSTAWSLSLPLPKPLDSSAGCTWQVSSENLWLRVPKKATGKAGKMEKKLLLTSPHIFAMCE